MLLHGLVATTIRQFNPCLCRPHLRRIQAGACVSCGAKLEALTMGRSTYRGMAKVQCSLLLSFPFLFHIIQLRSLL